MDPPSARILRSDATDRSFDGVLVYGLADPREIYCTDEVLAAILVIRRRLHRCDKIDSSNPVLVGLSSLRR